MKRLIGLLALVGCDDSGPVQEPPPEGTPWVAEAYDVNVTLLGSTCAPGGLTAEAYSATATAIQNGVGIKWAQRSAAPDAETWFLEGTVCAEGERTALRLIGGRRDTVSGCQVITDVPPSTQEDLVDDCDPNGQATLYMDECARVSGVIEAQLTYASGCAHRSPCLLRLLLNARPTRFDPAAPPLPAACTSDG
jgi:hypothetical protein